VLLGAGADEVQLGRHHDGEEVSFDAYCVSRLLMCVMPAHVRHACSCVMPAHVRLEQALAAS